MTTIHMVKCIKCGKEWAKVSDDGLCEECIESTETELAIVDLWKSVSVINSLDNERLRLFRASLEKAAFLLKNKVNQL